MKMTVVSPETIPIHLRQLDSADKDYTASYQTALTDHNMLCCRLTAVFSYSRTSVARALSDAHLPWVF